VGLRVLVLHENALGTFEEDVRPAGRPGAPLAHVDDEGEVVHELVVNEKVAALVVPHEVRPLPIELFTELGLPARGLQEFFETCLEDLELG
jgi:hypothetical protein